MFEKIGRLAETAANNVSVSRRGFLGRLGQGALAVGGVLGGLLALSNKAQAGNRVLYLCTYANTGERGCYAAPCAGSSYQSCGGCPKLGCCKVASKTIIGTC